MAVIDRGTVHRPRTDGTETWIMLIEPKSTRHTGEIQSEITKNKQEWI